MGLDGWRLLTSEDPEEVMIMQAVANRTAEYKREMMESQANMIATAVAKIFK